MSYFRGPVIATRLVLAGVSGSPLYTNNYVYIALMCNIVSAGQINEILILTRTRQSKIIDSIQIRL